MSAPALLRVAAILHWFIAVGFGVFCVPAIRNLLSGRDIPTVMGFPAYGRGLLVGVCLAHPADLCPRLDRSDSAELAVSAVTSDQPQAVATLARNGRLKESEPGGGR